MKRIFLPLLIMGLFAVECFAIDNTRVSTMGLTSKEMAHYMAPAWNLGNTMEAGDYNNNYGNSGVSTETWWQSSKTTQAIIDAVKAKGFKSVRIPCAWVMGHITDKTNMTIDPNWITRVKEIIDYCLNDDLNVLINDHWDGGWLEHDGFTTGADTVALGAQLKKLWTNIATALKDYDERVLFGGMNEPGVGSASNASSGELIFSQYGTSTDAQMNQFVARLQFYEQNFIDAVRATGGNNANRILVVQGPQVDIDKTVKYFDMSKMKDTATDRLMIEIHYYSPYQFCQMNSDASWGTMQYYWQDSGYNLTSSTHKGTYSDASVTNSFKSLKTAFVDKGYPVVVGEYGAMWRDISSVSGEDQSKHNGSLQYWYKLVTQGCLECGLIPFQWDSNNCGNQGMSSIKRSTCSDGIPYILNGITEGASAGIAAFNTVYPETAKLATPTYVEKDGQYVLSCIDDGVGYEYEIKTMPVALQNGNTIVTTDSYTINVYATKDGYSKSDPLVLTVKAASSDDVNNDGNVNITDVSVLVNRLLKKK